MKAKTNLRAVKLKPQTNLTKEQAQVYQDNWNLSEAERENLDRYFLRDWSELELVDNICLYNSIPQVEVWGTKYIPVFTGKDMAVWDRICYHAANGWDPKPDPINNKYPHYWLSFRSGIMEGKRFSYVIIQENWK